MTAFVVVALVALGLVFGAYEIGKRSVAASVLLTPVLLSIAWYLLAVWKFSHGEGAAAGVVVIAAGAWFFGGLCVLWSAAMLFASYKVRGSVLAGSLLVFVVAPFVLLLTYRLVAPERDQSSHSATTAQAEPPMSSYLEGYAWATDNMGSSVSECSRGSAEFIRGCQSALSRYRTPPNK